MLTFLAAGRSCSPALLRLEQDALLICSGGRAAFLHRRQAYLRSRYLPEGL